MVPGKYIEVSKKLNELLAGPGQNGPLASIVEIFGPKTLFAK